MGWVAVGVLSTPPRALQTSVFGTNANGPVTVMAPNWWTPPGGEVQVKLGEPELASQVASSTNWSGSLVVPAFWLPKS